MNKQNQFLLSMEDMYPEQKTLTQASCFITECLPLHIEKATRIPKGLSTNIVRTNNFLFIYLSRSYVNCAVVSIHLSIQSEIGQIIFQNFILLLH